jgi:hypothetical protein
MMKPLCALGLFAALVLPAAAEAAVPAPETTVPTPTGAALLWGQHETPRPPHTPTLFAFLTPTGDVSLNWESATAAQGYRILRSFDAKAYTPIGEITGPRALSFTDTEPQQGRTCYYRVEAYNAVGPSMSNTAVVRLPAFQSPPQKVPVFRASTPGMSAAPQRKNGTRVPRVGEPTLKRLPARRH